MDAPTLDQIDELCAAGMLDLAVAVQLVLVRVGASDDESDYFDRIGGDLGREVRDLVHHVINEIPDPGVQSWLEESTPEEQAGLGRLVEHARVAGYRKDDLSDP